MSVCECCLRARAEYRINFPMAAFRVCGECAADTMAQDPDARRVEPMSLWAL